MTNAVASMGIVIQRGDGESNEAFTTIAEITSVGGPKISRKMIEVTALNATNGYREFISSFRDAGEVTVGGNWTRDVWDDWKDDFDSDSSVNYQIVFPDSGETTYGFAAFVSAVNPDAPFDEAISNEVTIKLTGEITMTS